MFSNVARLAIIAVKKIFPTFLHDIKRNQWELLKNIFKGF